MEEKISSLSNKLLELQAYSVLLSNKKISKILKSNYSKTYKSEIEKINEDRQFYNWSYSLDVRNFFNGGKYEYTINPSNVSTHNFVDYTTALNYTLKSKMIVENLILNYDIALTDGNMKLMKKLLTGKIDEAEFTTNVTNDDDESEIIIVTSEDLIDSDSAQKTFTNTICFEFPNVSVVDNFDVYPLAFSFIEIDGTKLIFNIFSEEDIRVIPHFMVSKHKIKKFLA